MLMKAEESCLLVIDVQEKLTPLVQQPQKLIENITWLIRVANIMNVPFILSEQYPKGLSPTVAAIKEIAKPIHCVQKTHFSYAADPTGYQHLKNTGRSQVVIVGIETHVCVLQTAIQLVQQGFAVFVVKEATSARSESDHLLALSRMQHHQIQLVSREMVLFEWAHRSDIPQFKTLSQDFLKS